MKKVRIIFCLSFITFLIPISSNSQYIPLLKSNATWHVYHWLEVGVTKTLQLTGDTVINNQLYKIMASSLIGDGPYFLRENTATKKVYQNVNSAEILLYDFNQSIGSIFSFYNPQMGADTINIHLDSISGTIDPLFFNQPTDWTTINPLRVFYFTVIGPGVPYQILWVEGLGSLSGVLLSAYPWGGGAWGETLLCHNSTSDTIDYHFVFLEEPNPCEGPIMGIDDKGRIPTVNIYPDPVSSNEIMISGENITLVQFFNSMAKNILNYSVSSTPASINISNLPKGIYLVKIQFKTSQSVIRKVIKI